MRKLWKFLSSMGFAVTLLVLLAAACALSSLVEQGLTKEAYAARYGEGTASLIMALQVNDAYHSVWFIALSGFLCLNLILCNIIRFSSFLQRYRLEKDPGKAVNTAGELGETGTAEPEAVFDSMGLKTRIRCRDAEGQEVLFAHRGAFGIWGPWVCHLGVLLLIAGFALGQMTMEEATVWGIPGDRVSLAGTGLTVTIDDFRTETREDGSVAQYITEMTVTDNDGKAEKVFASVNHPASAGGYSLYQNNTGWAASATVVRDGQAVRRKTLLPSGSMAESVLGLPDHPEYAIYFAGVRTMREEGQEERNVFFYDLYLNGALKDSYYFFGDGSVEAGEDRVELSPARFTLLVARRDRFAPLALAGGIITLLGLALAFYLQPKALWAVRAGDGKWILRGRCQKGHVLMQEQLADAVRAAEKRAKGE